MGLFDGGTGMARSTGGAREVAGGTSGGGAGISPLAIASGVLDTVGGIFSGATMGRFDYGKEGYTPEEAGQFAAQKAKAFTSGIPIAGGFLGGLTGLIASKIAQNKAEPIVENRQAKINAIEQYKMDKLKENRFFRNSDLFNEQNKNLFNPMS